MKKEDILNKLLAPVLVMVLGLVLLVNPDSASALIAKIIGWILVALAIGFGIAALVRSEGRKWKVACAIIFAIAGGWLHAHPLMLASVIGRFCGIFLIIEGFQGIRYNRRQGRRFLLPGITTAVGILLTAAPMSASRFVFSACGLVVLLIGVAMLLDNLRGNKRLKEPRDPDIIDAL